MKKHILKLSLCALLFSSCVSQIQVSDVTYQSVRNKDEVFNSKQEIPEEAKIYVDYNIDFNGSLTVEIKNLTDDIMIIDQTKSFVVNSEGISTPYYDPTIKTQTVTNISSNQTGTSVNLGAIGGALGVDGAIGQILNGVNVGNSNTNGQSVANTTYTIDLPQANIAPKGRISLKPVKINCLGYKFTESVAAENKNNRDIIVTNYTPTNSYCTLSVCISYSIDGGKTYKKLISDFYSNSVIAIPVKDKSKVNDALRTLINGKKDWNKEPFWLLNYKINDRSAESLRFKCDLYKFQ